MAIWFQGVIAGALEQYGAIPDQCQPLMGFIYHMLKKSRELAKLDV